MSFHRVACPWCEEDSALDGSQYTGGDTSFEVMTCQRCEGVSFMVIHARERNGVTELYISVYPPVGVTVDEVAERAREHGFILTPAALQKAQRMLDVAQGLFRFRGMAAGSASRN
jgi:hypothetical protein